MIDIKKDIFARLVVSAKSLREMDVEDTGLRYNDPDPSIVDDSVVNNVVDNIESKVENLAIVAIRKELDNAEEIFSRIKATEKNKGLIIRIENKLLRLRQMIDEKSYY